MMIEAYLWAGDAAGPLYAQSAQITEGATTSAARPTSPALASAVLDSWVSTWTTATGTRYLWTWDRSTNRITIYNTGSAVFTLSLLGSSAAALGFTSASYTGASTYTAETAPRVFLEPFTIDYGAPVDAGDVRLRALRYGRHRSAWWAGHTALEVKIIVSADQAEAMAGPLLRGRVRIDCSSQASAAASAANIGGTDMSPASVRRANLQAAHTSRSRS